MIESMSRGVVDAGRSVLVLGVVAAVSGCGSSAASKSSNQPTSSSSRVDGTKGSKPKDLCTVITATDAAGVFGEPAEPAPASGTERLVSGLCLYHHPGDDLTVRNLLQIRTYPGAQFYGEGLFPKRTAIPGFGRKAFEDVNIAAHKVVIQFVKDGSTGVVDYSTGAGVDVRSRASAVRVLAKKLAASM